MDVEILSENGANDSLTEIYICEQICILRDGGEKRKKKNCEPLEKCKGEVLSPKNVDKAANNKG